MATIDFGAMLNDSRRKVSLVAAADLSNVIAINGPCNVLCSGLTTFTVEVYRAFDPTGSDGVLVGTQTETDRAGSYDFKGRGYLYLKLSALSGAGPIICTVVTV